MRLTDANWLANFFGGRNAQYRKLRMFERRARSIRGRRKRMRRGIEEEVTHQNRSKNGGINETTGEQIAKKKRRAEIT